MWQGPLEKIEEYKYKIPKNYKSGMQVDGIIYADEKLLESIKKDKAPEQVANVATLPGIVKASLAMPDIHWGYGFCIGGVAATDIKSGGVISPGGVGFDINCGVRLLKTNLKLSDLEDRVDKLANALYRNIPSGVGSKGKVKLSKNEEKKVSLKGAKWAVENGFGIEEDIVFCEEQGAIEGAEPSCVSQRAYERGAQQLGTLGSGNHFLEVQVIEEVFDEEIASFLGLYKNSIVVMIHTGSRGFGYQICDDYIRVMLKAQEKYGISLPDRQLACAPFYSSEGQNYFCAMKAAANYAWCNRQIIMHLVRKSFGEVFSSDWKTLGMFLIYDVAHNIAKVEKYTWEGEEKVLCVHRKGATRAFGPDNVNLPQKYLPIGQPVIIPGDMGRASYLLTGTRRAEEETFGTTCHGAGRLKSRHQALKTVNFNSLIAELEKKGIYVRATGKRTILEEAPSAYKDVNEVVDVVEQAGISQKICKMKPLCVVKG